jgi:Ser-tRNA(Ala) deacylase AlaX
MRIDFDKRVQFRDDAAVAAMVAFREKFDFSQEQNYKDCAAMAFKLATALMDQRTEVLTEEYNKAAAEAAAKQKIIDESKNTSV